MVACAARADNDPVPVGNQRGNRVPADKPIATQNQNVTRTHELSLRNVSHFRLD
jgi:hypothetical protein